MERNQAPQMDAREQFLTLPEVQNYLGIKSRKTLLKYIQEGELPAYKIGGTRWRFSRKDVESFLQRYFVSHDLPPRKAPPPLLTAGSGTAARDASRD